jgi:ethanolamine kinase
LSVVIAQGRRSLIEPTGECKSHSLLASHKLAPPLLARFNNGLLYRFIQGEVASPADLRRPEIWRAVARRLAEWHATLPISAILEDGDVAEKRGRPKPNVWTVTRRWTDALPEDNPSQKKRKALLQEELTWLENELGDAPGIDGQSLVFSHCDLLHGNVIMLPSASRVPSPQSSSASSPTTASVASVDQSPHVSVNFIDYEYATPAPAVFDISNHFAEWGGFDCDFTVLPTRSQRRDFLKTYLQSYNSFRGGRAFKQEELDQLYSEVDRFRGAPGFYWGVWALIQATISQIDFDYASYAEIRLGEYWAWKESLNPMAEREIPIRERRWAEEE